MGPHTVMSCLNFALGKPIDTFESRGKEPRAAVGLEQVAVMEHNDDNPGTSSLGLKTARMDTFCSSYSLLPTEYESDLSDERSTGDFAHHYGAISDEIGEASACWLARWAKDMLRYEEGLNIRPRRLSSQMSPSTLLMSDNNLTPSNSIQSTHIIIWARGGLSSDWVSALVSADTLFVKGERERYDLACSVVELRRRGGVLEVEEQVWNKMFEQGIYYANMVIIFPLQCVDLSFLRYRQRKTLCQYPRMFLPPRTVRMCRYQCYKPHIGVHPFSAIILSFDLASVGLHLLHFARMNWGLL